MKFYIFFLNKSPFYAAVEKENIQIIKLLLTKEKLDINMLNISAKIYFNII